MSTGQYLHTPLPIIGLGLWSALGSSVAQTRNSLWTGMVNEPELLDPTEKQFIKLNLKNPRLQSLELGLPEIENLFPPNLLALHAVSEALDHAQLSRKDLAKIRVGVCLGSTVGGTNYKDSFSEALHLNKHPSLSGFESYFATNSAQFIAKYFGLRGPVVLVSNACTSGMDAVGTAALWLKSDLCDLVICGGTETVLPRLYAGFKSLFLTSATNECRPFDRDRNGFLISEACGVLILAKSAAVLQTSQKVHSYYLGSGCASDAYNPTAPHPEARGLQQAVKLCCEEARLELDEFDFIHAHGVGSAQSDLAEGNWLKKNALNQKIVATKGFTGHAVGASGALSAVLTAIFLQDQKLPKSKNFLNLDEAIGFSPTEKIESGNYNKALTFSLGFGGSNSCVALGRGDA